MSDDGMEPGRGYSGIITGHYCRFCDRAGFRLSHPPCPHSRRHWLQQSECPYSASLSQDS